jgi:hypothetical protein
MKKHPILWTLAAIVGVAIVISAYIVFGPHPTDFAGGKIVSLGEYHGGGSHRLRRGGTALYGVRGSGLSAANVAKLRAED